MEMEFYALFGAILSSLVVEIAKQWKLPNKVVLLVLSLFFAGMYVVIRNVAPAHILEALAVQTGQVMAFSVTLYEFVLKHIWLEPEHTTKTKKIVKTRADE